MSAIEQAAEVLVNHEHIHERRVSPSHACSCGEWEGDFDWDGGPNDGQNDTFDAWAAHVAHYLAAAGLLADPDRRDQAEECACVGYTIRTDYGTGVEHDVDRSDCPVHDRRDQAGEGLREAVQALVVKYDERFGPYPNGFCRDLPIHEVTGDLRAALAAADGSTQAGDA